VCPGVNEKLSFVKPPVLRSGGFYKLFKPGRSAKKRKVGSLKSEDIPCSFPASRFAERAGIADGGDLKFVRPEQLPGFLIKLNIKN
jgi:hypothetical protein